MRIVDSSPHPSILIESLRDFGYNLGSALADVVDNSISAGSTTIDIFAEYLGDGAYIAILDNGRGMPPEELLEAMRLGSKSPSDSRDETDLGRFGLGLKTASFSQCRKLTVVSRSTSPAAGYMWDLDHVVKTNKWQLLSVDRLSDVPHFKALKCSGTLVLWQQLDRLEFKTTFAENQNAFSEQLNLAADHLALVFHRLMGKTTIYLNGRVIEPIDPFLSSHKKTQRNPAQPEPVTVNGHTTYLQGFTLPSPKHISNADIKKLNGVGGLTKNQGFYVYRNHRLITWGTWFGLAPKKELSQLARVRVDIGNATDSDWKIDVRKSSAQPPLAVRDRMKQLLNQLVTPSERTFRGIKRRESQAEVTLWHVDRTEKGERFTPNMMHPMVRRIRCSLSGEVQSEFDHLLETLAALLPIEQIYARVASDPRSLDQTAISDLALNDLIDSEAQALRSAGFDWAIIRRALLIQDVLRLRTRELDARLDQLRERESTHDTQSK